MADFYSVLGVGEKATNDEIKTAYRKLARQWHPDKNANNPQAKEMFQKIAHAYEILSDPSKRSAYDTQRKYGATDPQGSYYQDPTEGMGGMPDDFFSNFADFGGGDPSQGMGGNGPSFVFYTFGGDNSKGFKFSDPMEIFNQFFGMFGDDDDSSDEPFEQERADLFNDFFGDFNMNFVDSKPKRRKATDIGRRGGSSQTTVTTTQYDNGRVYTKTTTTYTNTNPSHFNNDKLYGRNEVQGMFENPFDHPMVQDMFGIKEGKKRNGKKKNNHQYEMIGNGNRERREQERREQERREQERREHEKREQERRIEQDRKERERQRKEHERQERERKERERREEELRHQAERKLREDIETERLRQMQIMHEKKQEQKRRQREEERKQQAKELEAQRIREKREQLQRKKELEAQIRKENQRRERENLKKEKESYQKNREQFGWENFDERLNSYLSEVPPPNSFVASPIVHTPVQLPPNTTAHPSANISANPLSNPSGNLLSNLLTPTVNPSANSTVNSTANSSAKSTANSSANPLHTLKPSPPDQSSVPYQANENGAHSKVGHTTTNSTNYHISPNGTDSPAQKSTEKPHQSSHTSSEKTKKIAPPTNSTATNQGLKLPPIQQPRARSSANSKESRQQAILKNDRLQEEYAKAKQQKQASNSKKKQPPVRDSIEEEDSNDSSSIDSEYLQAIGKKYSKTRKTQSLNEIQPAGFYSNFVHSITGAIFNFAGNYWTKFFAFFSFGKK